VQNHEGFRSRPYADTEGHLTIGWGRNLDAVGISWDEASAMLDHDIMRARRILQHFDWWDSLDEVRQDALTSVVFCLGNRVHQFKRMLAALEAGEHKEAARELLDSRYAEQTGRRAAREAMMLRTGEYPENVVLASTLPASPAEKQNGQ